LLAAVVAPTLVAGDASLAVVATRTRRPGSRRREREGVSREPWPAGDATKDTVGRMQDELGQSKRKKPPTKTPKRRVPSSTEPFDCFARRCAAESESEYTRTRTPNVRLLDVWVFNQRKDMPRTDEIERFKDGGDCLPDSLEAS